MTSLETFDLKPYFDAYGILTSLSFNQVQISGRFDHYGQFNQSFSTQTSLVAKFNDHTVTIGDAFRSNNSQTISLVKEGAPQIHWIWYNITGDFYSWVDVSFKIYNECSKIKIECSKITGRV
jgi:hypothetical protein